MTALGYKHYDYEQYQSLPFPPTECFQVAQTLPYHSYDSLKLERVYGSGSCAAAPIACPHPVVPGLLAYSCGAVVVLYDSQYKQQTSFFSPKPRRTLVSGKPFVSLAFSRDGAYLAAGERSAQGPEILIWEVSANRCLQALKGHKHGVGSLAFSQDGRLRHKASCTRATRPKASATGKSMRPLLHVLLYKTRFQDAPVPLFYPL